MSLARVPAAAAFRPSRSLIGHALYALLALSAVACAAVVKTDGYVANILMQAATYAIAVFGLSVVLGLCGQINLAQAAFFALGAYAVGLGTADYQLPRSGFASSAGMALAFVCGRGCSACRPCASAVITSRW